MGVNLKRKLSFTLIAMVFIVGFIIQAEAEAEVEEPQIAAQKTADTTRIVISTSGPAKFSSHWLDSPSRLVIEFQSRNIISQMDKEVIVNQGVIKRIVSSYFEEEKGKSLKSLTFELTQKVPCKIWQENNAILLDIKAPLETPVFQGSKEIFTESEASDVIIERLKAMDTALMQVAEGRAPLEVPEVPLELTEVPLKIPEVETIAAETPEEISKAEEAIMPKAVILPTVEPTRESKTMEDTVFLLAGLILFAGLGFLVRHRQKTSINRKLKRLKTKLWEKKEQQQQERERPSIPERLRERRTAPRSPLTKDFSKTIILRAKSPDMPQSIKSFADNISFKGLRFKTTEEFKEKGPVNLRLICYGGYAPMMEFQAHIVWKKSEESVNYYGVSFGLLEEKDKSELNRFAGLGR